MSKKKQFQSKEAQAVAHVTEELNILSDAIDELDQLIGDKGLSKTEKKLLQQKKIELKAQEALNKTRQNHAVTKFSKNFGNSMSADEITNEVSRLDNSNAKSTNVTKVAEYIGNGLNTAVQAYAKLATIESEKEYERISAQTDILMADIDALGQKAVMAAELQAKAYTAAIDSSLSNLIDGINEGAYKAASNLIDLGAQSKIFELEQERIDLENKNTKELRTAQKEATFKNLGAQKTQAITNIASEALKLSGQAMNDMEVSFMGFGFSTGDAPGAIADAAATVAEGAAAANTALTDMEGKLSVQKFENEKKITEARLKYGQEVEKKWIEAGANVEKAWLSFAQHLEGGLLKSEAAANELGVGLGLSGKQLESFKKSMFESQVTISKWGKTLEDMQKVMSSYNDSTGRNIQFSTNDFDTSFALDKLAGQDGLSAQLTSAMELFNHSVSDSNEMFYEMYKNVSKIGLNGRKYLKDLSKNLKLAERFQFKNGVKGMMDMAKWAQNTRFNMDSLDGMLQNFSENGLEGAITKAAGMQVLGGNFAMGADPLAMLWERYNDPQAFAQRQQDMLKGIGSYDAKTGEVTFNMGEQIQMEQFAKYTGQSVQDLMNQQRQRIKGEQMEKSLNNGVNLSDDEKSLITNKAQLVNGEWKVTMVNGKQKSVSQLNSEDLNHLKPEDNEEKLVNYVYNIMNMMTKLTGVKQKATAKLELGGYSKWYEENQTRIQNVVTDFNNRYQEYLTEFEKKMSFVTGAQKTMLDLMGQGNTNIDNASSQILQEGTNIATTLHQVNLLLQNSLNELNNMKTEAWRRAEAQVKAREKANTQFNKSINNVVSKPFTSAATNNRELHESAAEVCRAEGHKASAVMHEIASYGPPTMPDGIVSALGNPMSVAASKVTPIHDGTVATTDPQDHAIFAKTGGPFDTLFNGIFAKINEISSVLPRSMEYIMPLERIFNEISHSKGTANNSKIQIEPIKLIIEGKLDLGNSNGQSVDIINEIKNNPILLRTLTQLISESINKNINGGKSTYTGGVVTPRFN